MKDFKYFLIEKDEGIAVITFNRPEALNALSIPLMEELEELVDSLPAEKDIQVAIFTGAGEKAFIAGGDIKVMYPMTPHEAKEYAKLGQRVLYKIENLEIPTIGAINGYALGGGTEVAMAFDIRIASERAVFGQPEVYLGITPGYAGTQRLPRLVGKGMGKMLIFTGDHISAEEAYRIGLVQKVVPHEKLLEEAKALARRIMKNSPVAVRLAKVAINQGLEMDFWSACVYEAHVFGMCFTYEDQSEGMSAFIEKRKPQFSGKMLPKIKTNG
ncbi:MAG: crotonase [Firmicutes bacterium]|nr:crotonase [Bacillota bacterium]